MCIVIYKYLRLLSSIYPSGLFMQSKTSIPRDITVKTGQDGDIKPKIKNTKTHKNMEEHNKCGTILFLMVL